MRYNTHSHALSILALTATILFVFSGPGYSQTADQYFEWGKAYLESGSLVDAHTNFENALSVDPNHNGANFFYALTSILMISESSEFNDLLDQAGVSGTGRDIFNWEADFNRNVYGDVILPPDAPTGADFQDFAKNEVLPVIEGAVSNMENVDDSFLTYFNWAFERGEGSPVMTNTFETYTDYWYTNEWAGFKLIVEGAEYDILSNTHDTLTVSPSLAVGSGTYDYMIIAPIEIDYGDALVLRGGLNLAKAAIRIYTAYNFDADIDTLLPLFYAETFDIQADAIDLYPQFLTLLPTHELAEAKTDIRESITQLNDAIDFILSEVDAQGNDFIVVSASEGAEFKARFTEVDNALDGPVLVEVEELQIQVDLSEFFDDPKNLRDYIPNFYGIRIARGSFPDPTFGGIFPAMTDTELYGYLDEMRILTPSKDFNGDGKADILWRDESNGEVHVWYMDGETRLGTGYIDTVPDMSWKIVAEADFNRDHKPDLLWRQASTGNIVIWFMNGLALTGTASLPSLSGADWEVTGVIDNSKYYRYIFWRNVSTGENIYWRLEGQYYQYSGSLPSLSTAWDAGDVADYNADDIPDIIWRNGSTGENMVWYLNYSGIPTSASLPALADTNWRIVRVFDFSSDGKPDILWHNSATGKNAVWFMNGASKESTANLEDPASANWLIFDVEDASPASLKSDVLFDFGSGTGLWARYNNATWAKLHNLSPEIIAAGDMDGNGQDDGIVDFGPGTGIYVLYNNTTWTKLHSLSAEIIATGDLDGNGKDDCIIDFGTGVGIYVRYNNQAWTKLHSLSPEIITTGDLDGNGEDDCVVDFGSGIGVYVRYNNSSWTKLHALSPEIMAIGDLDGSGQDDCIMDFGSGVGIYVRYNNTTWTKLHSLSPEIIAAGDLDGNGEDEAIIDFGSGIGIYVWSNNTSWAKLHSLSPEIIATGDMDGNGLDECIMDFGSGIGIYVRYNNAAWSKLHSMSPESIAAGNLD